MSFLQHLDELRLVLMRSLLAVAAGAIGGLAAGAAVMEDVIRRTVQHVVVLAPMEAFNERLKLSVVLGLAIALRSSRSRSGVSSCRGCSRRERRLILPLALSRCMLFALGPWPRTTT